MRFKKAYLVDLSRADSEGFLIEREVLDLLSIRDPDRISQFEREGNIGLGDLFSFPFQTIESILRWRMGGCSCSTATTTP